MVLTTVSPGGTCITHSDIYDSGTDRFFGATTSFSVLHQVKRYEQYMLVLCTSQIARSCIEDLHTSNQQLCHRDSVPHYTNKLRIGFTLRRHHIRTLGIVALSPPINHENSCRKYCAAGASRVFFKIFGESDMSMNRV